HEELAVADLQVQRIDRGMVAARIGPGRAVEPDSGHAPSSPSPAGTCRTIRVEGTPRGPWPSGAGCEASRITPVHLDRNRNSACTAARHAGAGEGSVATFGVRRGREENTAPGDLLGLRGVGLTSCGTPDGGPAVLGPAGWPTRAS